MKLCNGHSYNDIKPSILHPTKSNEKLFLLIDPTHNFKNLFNNWVNTKRFYFPNGFEDLFPESGYADFQHIKDLYFKEELSELKIAHSLKKHSLCPSNIARTSPQHALSIVKNLVIIFCNLYMYIIVGIFNDHTIRGLEYYNSPGWKDTAAFCRFSHNMWKILNVKSTSKGEFDLCLKALLR